MAPRYDYQIIEGRFILHRLFRRGGTWWCRVRDQLTGKIVRRNTRKKNKRQAQDFAEKWLSLEAKRDTQIKDITFLEAIRKWAALKVHLREKSREDLTYSIDRVYLPALGERLVNDIDLEAVEEFIRTLGEKKRAPKTIRKHLANLRAFFRWAMKRKYCASDPTDGIKLPRGARRRGVALSVEQSRALIQACRKPYRWHLFLAVMIALHTGLRRGNVLRLRWEQLDLERRRLRIAAGEMKANEEHIMPIHPELAEVLLEKLRQDAKIDPKAPVIGRSIKKIRAAFLSALRDAGLPQIRWHDLRHTFSTWLSTRCPFAVQQELMGHSPRSVTFDYIHLPWEELDKGICALPRLLPPAGQAIAGDISNS